MEKKNQYTFEDLRAVMDRLRGDNGCPWDREQTHESLKNSTIEETYELIEAINEKDDENLKEELGDLLLHVVFHSKIASDDGRFDLDGVIHTITEKLIRRHPHVFAEVKVENSEEVLNNWEAIKKVEKQYTTLSAPLVSVPRAMPALMRAQKVQKRAAKVGFDFPNWEEAYKKVYEEIEEFHEAVQKERASDMEEEYGDLLFAMVNISRFFEINPEISLTNATEKFINRFKGIEESAENKGLQLDKLSIHEMDKLWEDLKKVDNNHC